MASEMQQVNVVFKTMLLNQHSQRQLIHIADSKHAYVGIKIPSPNKWLVYFISVYPDSNGSRITDIHYSINSETYKRMEQSNQRRAAIFHMEELNEIAGDHPNVGVLPIKFSFTLIDTVPDFQLQRLDNRMAMNLWSSAVNRQFTDIDLVVGNYTFPAHRAILAARSPVFAAMFQNDANGKAEHRRIEITDVPPATFDALIKFMYMGNIHGSVDNRQLYLAASLYQVETLKRLCRSSI